MATSLPSEELENLATELQESNKYLEHSKVQNRLLMEQNRLLRLKWNQLLQHTNRGMKKHSCVTGEIPTISKYHLQWVLSCLPQHLGRPERWIRPSFPAGCTERYNHKVHQRQGDTCTAKQVATTFEDQLEGPAERKVRGKRSMREKEACHKNQGMHQSDFYMRFDFSVIALIWLCDYFAELMDEASNSYWNHISVFTSILALFVYMHRTCSCWGINMGGDSERTLKCFTCRKYFAHKRSLDRHIDVEHKNEQRFVCQHCSRVYNRKDNLMPHCRDRQQENFQNRGRSQSWGRHLGQSKSDHRHRRFSRSLSRSRLPNRMEDKKEEDREKQVVQAELECDESPPRAAPGCRLSSYQGRSGGKKWRGKKSVARKDCLVSIRHDETNSPVLDSCGCQESPSRLSDSASWCKEAFAQPEGGSWLIFLPYNGAEKVFQEMRERKYAAIFLRHSADVRGGRRRRDKEGAKRYR